MSKPNVVIIMTDQQRADVSKREGFPLDTTPFLDSLATQGTWFNRAYTSMPACLPARVSMLTGRYPSATHARTNHNEEDAFYETDLYDVMREQGYKTALCGKNHSHLKPDRMDYYFELSHGGGFGDDRTDDEKAFDDYLSSLSHRADSNPAPFGVEVQCPYRAVSAAMNWLDTIKEGDDPFFLWLSFPEPHNPYQVPEPYFSMFPPETLPPTRSDKSALEKKGFKFQWLRHIGETAFPDYAEQLPRARANYFGMLRLIDDQIQRFVEYLDNQNLRENTLIIFLSDHGDYVGEYGLVRKGAELPEVLTRIPFQVMGPGVVASDQPHDAHISIVDIMPTICEAVGVDLPAGVQGQSLWPLLTGQDYPKEEFASAYAEHGFGGLHYTADDDFDPYEDGLNPVVSFDELNGWSQSGTMRMLRKGDWKLMFDMQGRGQLYHLSEDPVELNNLYGVADYQDIQSEMVAELLAWTLRAQDPLPHPRRRYKFKSDPRNYWSPHR
ncbi:sulfatase-like hydrolase/transferase [Phototrophicus methaneseepsis]|uniref:Sulfatase-like hydrolase/transferase n=1 Tax=Phototrophicus methaneseepsis TaxID=2710758 RepID=A0A7S8IDZ3_9CHLR|nr:sulfatase-like hydrolase/transferase [Phototrophicus methaneseepsis]QPC81313.1 sulfatase-like hydrolase/transferase [Phototrophicus methaneseepsis]